MKFRFGLLVSFLALSVAPSPASPLSAADIVTRPSATASQAAAAKPSTDDVRTVVITRNGKKSTLQQRIRLIDPKHGQVFISSRAHKAEVTPKAFRPKSIVVHAKAYVSSTSGKARVHPRFGGPGTPTINAVSFGSSQTNADSVSMNLTYPAPDVDTTYTFAIFAGTNFTLNSAGCDGSATCNATVSFSPLVPGLLKDAVSVFDQNGNFVYETFLYGNGTAPQFGYDFGGITGFHPGGMPAGVAIGPDGSIYFGDQAINQVTVYSHDFSSNHSAGFTGIGTPAGVAVDGYGTVFVADQTNNRITYITPGGFQANVTTSTLSGPQGIAIDGNGTLYVCDTGNNRIIQIDNQGVESDLFDDVTSPQSVAVDSGGDIYYADLGSGGEIHEFLATGETLTLGDQLGQLQGLAVDAGGRVYYTSTAGSGTIDYNYGTTTTTSNGSMTDGPYGIAVDNDGDIITTQPADGAYNFGDRTTSNFVLDTPPNTTTTGFDSAENTGNDVLTISSISIPGPVFTLDPMTTCVEGANLNAGQPCNFVVDFTPPDDNSYQGSLAIVSNSLYNNQTEDDFTVYGQGVGYSTSTTLTTSGQAALINTPVTLTGTVANTAGNSSVPTGSIKFTDNDTFLVIVQLGQGQTSASYTTSSLPSGGNVIQAIYSGDSLFAGSQSAGQNVQIDPTVIGTAVSLEVSSASINSGQSETLTALVAGEYTQPTGTVTFSDQNGVLGTVAVTGSGQSGSAATLTLSNLTVGTHTITATYSGDVTFSGATSTPQTVTVNSTGISTTTALTVSPATFVQGQLETLSVTVTPARISGMDPDGSVNYLDTDGRVIGTSYFTGYSLTSQLATYNLSVGTHTITAVYSGDQTYAGSTSPSQVVTVTAASTTLGVSSTTTAYQTPVTFQINNGAAHFGQAVICDTAAPQCSILSNLAIVQINSDGNASVRLPVGSIGTHNFTATFLGTAAYTGGAAVPASISTPVTVTVTGKYPSTTTIAASGTENPYTLTGTVVGIGSRTLSPAGAVTFNDATNSSTPLLGTTNLGAAKLGFTAAQPTGSPVAVGANPYAVATGDFNSDGFADVVTANYGAGTISVLLGNGDGTFQPAVTYAVGGDPERVLVADFDGDGHPDIVVANTASDNVSILINNGDGTFQDQVTYGADSPVGLGILDLNHDGLADIAVGDYYAGTMSVLLNNGDGTFQDAVPYPTGSTPQTLAEGDFNGDGNIDIVVGNEGSASVSVYLGNGDGTFQAQVTYAVGGAPQGVQVGDFNGDGKADLAAVNSGDNTVSILLGKGDGTFQAQVTYPVGDDPVGLVIADLNGDGKEDIAVGNTAQDDLTESILLGNGDGTFQTQAKFPAANFPYGESAADFNGDGYPDLAISAFNSNGATILLSQVTQTANATLTNATLTGASGTHNVNAGYAGNANFTGSTSTTIPLINTGAPATVPSTTTLTATPATQTAGGSVTFSVTVAGSTQTAPIPSGTVTFINTSITPNATVGTITLASGSGMLSVTTLPSGSNIIVAKYSGDTAYAASTSAGQTVTITPAATAPVINSQNFGSDAVASDPAVMTLTYNVRSGVTPIATITNGSVFSSQTITCAQNVCSITVSFAPAYPGLASDALTLTDANGNLLDETFLYGTGTAPQLGFDLSYGDDVDGVYTGIIKSPASVAVGPDHNLYITDNVGNKVYQINPKNYRVATALPITGLGTPAGIAVSGDNTVYVVDQTNNAVRFFNLVTSAQGVVKTSTELSKPTGIAVDGTGALFITDTGNGRVIKIDDQGAESPLDAQIDSPTGIAVDSAGNIFYGDAGSGGEISKIFADGGAPVSVATNLGVVNDIAVEPSGRIFFASTMSVSAITNGVVRTNGYFNLTGDSTNYGMALDQFADVITTNTSGGTYIVTGRAGSGFYVPTPIGTTRVCCDFLSNTGNAPLTITSLKSVGAGFTVDTSAGECMAGQVVQPATTCSAASDFTPLTTQTYTNTLTVTSNSLNAPGSTNNTYLTGPGQPIATTTALVIAPNPATQGETITFTANLTPNTGSPTEPTGSIQFLNGTAVLGTVPLTGLTAQYTTATLAAGSYGITAAYSGDDIFAASTSAAQTLVVNQPAQIVTVTSISPNSGAIGSPATTITVTGTALSRGDIVQLNGASISSTYVSPTSLTAIIPASFFTKAQIGQITVQDPESGVTSNALPFTVSTAPQIVFSGPSTAPSGQQPTLTFKLVNPYPVALAGTLTLTFAPATATGINDPSVQFATGGRTLNFNIPANSTVTPTVQLQTGTVAGTATIDLAVTANGVSVTPANVAPVVITIPPAVPTITSTTVKRDGNTLTVAVVGFSNTREALKAVFDFTAVAGGDITTPTLTLDVTSSFTTWYTTAASDAYGSAFTYTQVFNLDQDAAVVDSIKVTLSNTIGASAPATTQ